METTLHDLMTRRSVRSYTDEIPPKEVIEDILKAGMNAPSGKNRQSAIILAVTNREVRDTLSRLNSVVIGRDDFDPFFGAPVVLVVLADSTVLTWREDGALVMGNLLNAAHAKGLGCCWVHRAREVFMIDEGKELLKAHGIDPERYIGIGNCVLGYMKGDYPEAAPRKEKYVYWIE
jgi:nitroreductase